MSGDGATPRNPFPTVDVVVERPDGRVVLIARRNPPLGWALPGGFVDFVERIEDAARREVLEEVGVEVELVALLGVYSDPARDPRHHTQTTVYVGRAGGALQAGDDAGEVGEFALDALPDLAFDHARILADYARWKRTGELPPPG